MSETPEAPDVGALAASLKDVVDVRDRRAGADQDFCLAGATQPLGEGVGTELDRAYPPTCAHNRPCRMAQLGGIPTGFSWWPGRDAGLSGQPYPARLFCLWFGERRGIRWERAGAFVDLCCWHICHSARGWRRQYLADELGALRPRNHPSHLFDADLLAAWDLRRLARHIRADYRAASLVQDRPCAGRDQ